MTKRDSGTSPSEPLLTLEYRPSKPSATSPIFIEAQTTTTELQTTPMKTGTEIRRQLKNLVNQLHHLHPNSKLHMSTFRSAIAKRLRELGVESSHTDAYVKEMRVFSDELYKGSKEIMPI